MSSSQESDGVDPFLIACVLSRRPPLFSSLQQGQSLTTRSPLLSPPSRQFDRAVELVQTLPKNGPIQSSYEEKLALYSLYKQGTFPPPFFTLLAPLACRSTYADVHTFGMYSNGRRRFRLETGHL